jgi:hypothetical protein
VVAFVAVASVVGAGDWAELQAFVIPRWVVHANVRTVSRKVTWFLKPSVVSMYHDVSSLEYESWPPLKQSPTPRPETGCDQLDAFC